MDKITIAVVVAGIIGLAAFVKAVLYLKKQMKDAVEGVLADKFTGVNNKIDGLQTDMNQGFSDIHQKIDKSDMEACQNFLVHCLTDFDRGIGDDAMLQRFWKQYDYYRSHDGNSYIKNRVEDLVQNGKLRQFDK